MNEETRDQPSELGEPQRSADPAGETPETDAGAGAREAPPADPAEQAAAEPRAESANEAEPPAAEPAAEDATAETPAAEAAAEAKGAEPVGAGPASAEAADASTEESTAAGAEEAETPAGEAAAEEETPEEPPKSTNMDWYILKVASNRENSICDGLRRRLRVAGLEQYFDEIIVPTEEVREFKNGKQVRRKHKLWPGYIVVHMEINDDTWFLVRETPGIGDFTGAGGKPTPMLPEEVEKIQALIAPPDSEKRKEPGLKIPFNVGDRVKIKEGTFENFEGDVETVDESNGRVTVMINIFGRPTPVELDYWQILAV